MKKSASRYILTENTPGDKTQEQVPEDVSCKEKPAPGNPSEECKSRKGMSVKEMGDLLGIKKTERYWLVHRNVFETRIVAGKMWVDIESFEKWYANQVRYRKVTGEEPGKELKQWSYSIPDLAQMLGICEQRAYELIKTKNIPTVIVNYRIRVPKEEFDKWYAAQEHYRVQEDRIMDSEMGKHTLSMPEMASLLGISRAHVYQILKTPKYSGILEVVRIAGRRRITKESFSDFLQAQDHYKVKPVKDPMQIPPAVSGKNSFDLFPPTELMAAAQQLPDLCINSPSAGPQDLQQKKEAEYISLSEAAAMADLSRQAVSKYAKDGCFIQKKLGNMVRIRREEFENWLRDKLVRTDESAGLQSTMMNEE